MALISHWFPHRPTDGQKAARSSNSPMPFCEAPCFGMRPEDLEDVLNETFQIQFIGCQVLFRECQPARVYKYIELEALASAARKRYCRNVNISYRL